MVVMRGGLAAIQQTLTPEAASVLSNSIAEAARRNHGQTTPLHVAATLLVSPTGFLRQACIRSHPNSSHPLQCRALELCFSVALERLPTAQPASSASGPGQEPPISNALMAALKRAQAHQRRGCPEQQQQPLLAVKVELEQLIISILDDPSVSRVMREASFSSPAVKAAIEQAITSQPNSGHGRPGIGLGFGGAGVGPRNLYLNPRLQQQQHHQQQEGRGGGDDVRRVLDILLKPRKRNPVLVGESEPREIVKEVFRRIENDEIHDGVLKGASVISVEKEVGLLDRVDMPNKVKQLDGVISNKMLENSNGVILDLGDLKWLVDQGNNNQGVSDSARGVVCEMGKILKKFSEGKIWLIGIATCETYLRCQVYHPSMEIDWDLQVVSIVSKPPLSGLFPRLGSNGGIISSSVECLSPMKNFPMPVSSSALMTRRVPENLDPLRKFSCCPQCSEKYNQELVKLEAAQSEKSCSDVKSDADKQSLPLWLQNAKPNTNDLAQDKDRDLVLRQRTQELQKKWNEMCLQLHPSFHQGIGLEKIIPSPLSVSGLCNPNLLGRQPVQPKLAQPKALGDALQLNISPPMVCQMNSNRPPSPPGSPVGTDLVLGQTKLVEKAQEKIQKPQLKDLLGCISSDTDSYKKLLKGLMEKVWWQTEAVSAIASAITQCKMGNGKRRLGGTKGDIWLLFSGPDRIGKKKMAGALSELVCGMGPTLISLGSTRDGDESDTKFRGKTAIDRIAEAVRRHPFSVIVLQDIDEADMLVQGSVKRAMERGRISDSHGREISLGNVIFILTSNWIPDQFKSLLSKGGLTLNEEKLMSLASGGWQLRISIGEKNTGKRSPPNWLHEGRSTKQRKEVGSGLTFDLNQMAYNDDDRLDGSHNSSDLTVDHEDEHGQENRGSPTTSSPPPEMLLGSVDEAIIFKPVDFTSIKNNIERTILARFSGIAGNQIALKLDNEALERILSGVWLGQTTIESWIDKVMIPSMYQLKSTIMSKSVSHEGKTVAHLELDKETDNRGFGDWLPGRISVVDDAN